MFFYHLCGLWLEWRWKPIFALPPYADDITVFVKWQYTQSSVPLGGDPSLLWWNLHHLCVPRPVRVPSAPVTPNGPRWQSCPLWVPGGGGAYTCNHLGKGHRGRPGGAEVTLQPVAAFFHLLFIQCDDTDLFDNYFFAFCMSQNVTSNFCP